jgi:hypothetical protein
MKLEYLIDLCWRLSPPAEGEEKHIFRVVVYAPPRNRIPLKYSFNFPSV